MRVEPVRWALIVWRDRFEIACVPIEDAAMAAREGRATPVAREDEDLCTPPNRNQSARDIAAKDGA